MTSKDIIQALKLKYKNVGRNHQWAIFEELRVGTGYKSKKKGLNPEQRIDVWIMNLWPSHNHLKMVFEIKVSRGDFLNEIKKPSKRKQAVGLSNQFYFIVPKGMLKVEEIPADCGLMEVNKELKIRIIKEAPTSDCALPSWNFFASIARRIYKAEEKERYEENQEDQEN